MYRILKLFIAIFTFSYLLLGCGVEQDNSKTNGLRGLDKKYVLRTNTRLDEVTGVHTHTLVACKIRETYTVEVQDQACKPALKRKGTGEILTFNKTPGPSLIDKVKGPAKAAAFLLLTSAGVIFVSNQARLQKVLETKIKPLISQHSGRVKGFVSNSGRSKDVIPAPIFQGILGISAVSLSSTFTLMFLSNIPGHGDREVIKYWQDLFGPYGAPHLYEFPYAIKIDEILKSAAESNDAEVIWENVEWAKGP